MSTVINGGDELDPITGEVIGTSDADKINSGGGDDDVLAGAGDDTINAGDGDDVITGGAGDDSIKGGDGFDTAVYEGSVTDYISVDTDGDGIDDALAIEDGKGNTLIFSTGGEEGTDTLKQVEALRFLDYTYYLDGTNNAVLAIEDESSVSEDGARNNINLLANDVDLDGDALEITHIDGQAISIGGSVTLSSGAIVSLNSDYSINYQSNGQFEYLVGGENALDSLSYTVTDNQGSTVEGLLSMTIQGVDDISRGNAIDGYLVGSTVFADANNNGLLDAGEASSQTDGEGGFTLSNAAGALVLQGGVDISTGLAFEGSLRAPEGSSAITALSTIVLGLESTVFHYTNQAGAGGTLGFSPLGASLAVKEAFGININADLLNIDPIAQTLAGNENGESIMAMASQVLNTVTQIAAMLQGAGSTTDSADIYDVIFQQITLDLAQAYIAADFNFGTYALSGANTDQLESLIQDSATALGVSLSSELIEGAAQVISQANEQTQAALDSGVGGEALLTEVAQISIVTQGEISNALESAAQTGTTDAIEQVVVNYTDSNLLASISQAESSVGDIDGLLPATASAGGYVVIWESNHNTPYNSWDVYGQRYALDGQALGNEFKVNTVEVAREAGSSVTGLSDGGFVIVYTSTENGGEVRGQRFDSEGLAIGDEFETDHSLSQNGYKPVVTALSDGGFVVTQLGDNAKIYVHHFDSDGQESSPAFMVANSLGVINPTFGISTTALSGGGLLVTWSGSGGGDNQGIYAQRYDANMQEMGQDFLVNSDYLSGGQISSSATSLNNGEFLITWYGQGSPDTSNYGVYGQRYAANGQELGNNFLVNTENIIGLQGHPNTTALADGGYVITWFGEGAADPSIYGIYGQRYDAQGQALDDNFLVNSDYTLGYQAHPAVAASDDGGFLITWFGDGAGGVAQDIYGQRYDANGQAIDGNFQINSSLAQTQWSPSVASLAAFNFSPVAANDSAETGEDAGPYSFTFAELLSNDLDIDGDALSISAFDDSGLPAGVTLSADFTAQTVSITYGDTYQSLSDGEKANLSFGYTLSDDRGATSQGSVSLTVNGANDAPVIGTADTLGGVTEAAAAAGAGAQSIGFESLSSATTYYGDVPATYEGYTFAPLYPESGFSPRFWEADESSVSYVDAVTDAAAGDNTAIYTPNGSGLVIESESGGSFNLQSAEFAVFGDYETTLWVTGYDAAGAVIAEHQQTIDGTQAHQITFTGFDGVTRVEVATQGNPIHDPTPNTPLTYAEGNRQALVIDDIVLEETASSSLSDSGLISFSDVDLSDAHTVGVVDNDTGYRGAMTALVNDDSTGGVPGQVTWTFDVADADINDLAAGETLIQTYDITLDDGHGGTATETVSITITGTNDAPVGADDSATTSEDDGAITFRYGDLLANDTDVDGDALSVIAFDTLLLPVGVTQTYDTSAADAADHTVTVHFDDLYQDLNDGESEDISFRYMLADGNGGNDWATVTTTINGITEDVSSPTQVVLDFEDLASHTSLGTTAYNGFIVDTGLTFVSGNFGDPYPGTLSLLAATQSESNAMLNTQSSNPGIIYLENHDGNFDFESGYFANHYYEYPRTITVTGYDDVDGDGTAETLVATQSFELSGFDVSFVEFNDDFNSVNELQFVATSGRTDQLHFDDLAFNIGDTPPADTGGSVILDFDDLESVSSNTGYINPYDANGYNGFDFGAFFFHETDERNYGGSENLANLTGTDNVLYLHYAAATTLGGYVISSEDGSEFDLVSMLMAKDYSGADDVTFTAIRDGVEQGSTSFSATQAPQELNFDQSLFSNIDSVRVDSISGSIAFDNLTFESVDWIV